MRLVIDGRRLGPGRTGVGRYLEGLLAEWSAQVPPLPEGLLVLRDPRARELVPPVDGLDVAVVGERLPGLAWEHLGLGRLLRPDDLLFAPTNLVPGSWRGRTVLVLFDLIQEVRPNDFPRLVRWRFGPRYRRAARRADRVIVPSLATARDARRIYGVPADRLRVIHPAPGPEFRPRSADAPEVGRARDRLGHDSPFFLFIGKRSRRRNIPALLAAFALHRERHPTHRLVFVGPDGGTPVLPGDGVQLAGHVDEPTLLGLLAIATAVIYPSEYEGFGLPVVEALACGCPVVTLRNSALVEAAGDAAYDLEAATPESLADAMHRLATDRALRDDLIARGLLHAATLSRRRFAEEVGAVIAGVAQPARGS